MDCAIAAEQHLKRGAWTRGQQKEGLTAAATGPQRLPITILYGHLVVVALHIKPTHNKGTTHVQHKHTKVQREEKKTNNRRGDMSNAKCQCAVGVEAHLVKFSSIPTQAVLSGLISQVTLLAVLYITSITDSLATQ
jgi:hypothetical protein